MFSTRTSFYALPFFLFWTFPLPWKCTQIFHFLNAVIFSGPNNYGLISLISVISYVFETIFIDQLWSFLEREGLLSDPEYEFVVFCAQKLLAQTPRSPWRWYHLCAVHNLIVVPIHGSSEMNTIQSSDCVTQTVKRTIWNVNISPHWSSFSTVPLDKGDSLDSDNAVPLMI